MKLKTKVARKAKKYITKMVNEYALVDNEPVIVSQMYRYKPPRRNYLNTISTSSLRNQVKRQVNKTNRRLKSLIRDVNKGVYNPKTKRFERKGTITIIDKNGNIRKIKSTNIKDYRGKFASKKLEELESFNKKLNKIELSGNESRDELLEINKLTENFLKSKTSTLSGIEEVEKGIKDNISAKLDEFDMTPSEVDSLYTLYEDKDFVALRKYLDPSELQALMMEVKEYRDELYNKENVLAGEDILIDDEINQASLNKFAELFVSYAGLDKKSAGLDQDLQDALSSLYKKIDTIL